MKGKVDVKKLISQLTLEMYEQIFKELNIPIYSNPKGATHWVLYTACHNKDPYNGSPKLYFYLDTKIFMCYTGCSSAMNIVSLVMKRLTLLGKPDGFINAINTILSITGLDPDAVSRISGSKYQYDWEQDFGKFVRFKNGMLALPEYDKSILSSLTTSVPQAWIDEGISVETMQKYQIGYYERNCATTIPCFDKEGRLIGIRTRNWNPQLIKEYGKYYPLFLLDSSNYTFPTEKAFYGINFNWPEIEKTKTCILVEGEKSVLKADTFWGVNSNVLGLYGSNLGTKRRNELVKMGVDYIVIALDSDFHVADDSDKEYVKFKEKILKFAEPFKGYCKVDIVYNNIGLENAYKASPFDFDKETFGKMYENREQIYGEEEKKKESNYGTRH